MEQELDDRISALPEPILQHILSFIPFKQIAQSSIVSKTWNMAWTSFPFLKFDREFFHDTEPKQQRINELYNFIERIVLNRHRQELYIQKFELYIPLQTLHQQGLLALVNSCIGYAIELNVKELNLYTESGHFSHYSLHQNVLVSKSITELCLYGCNLKLINSGDINLPNLKKLVFDTIPVNDQIIQNLVDGCPVVEDVRFSSCDGLESIKLSGISKLMALELGFNRKLKTVVLQASSLQSLKIKSSLKYPEPWRIFNMVTCKNLKKLLLYSTNAVTDRWLHKLLSELLLVEELCLLRCFMLERIKISGHCMKSLSFYSCQNLVEVDIDTPNLDNLSYNGQIISFSLKALKVLKVCLTFVGSFPETASHDKMIEFLRKSSDPKSLTLDISTAEDAIIPKELRQTLPSPSYNVKQLKLQLNEPPIMSGMNKLVDVLLWISPLLDGLIIEWGLGPVTSCMDNISFKFSYKKPIYKVENTNCCKLLPFPCWRHCLKTVQIESLRGSADKKSLKKYFYENAENLKRFKYVGGPP
ncbi:hypothetical protein I3760_15G144400 [Carya illinoinensis]|nr:hypothetical protein I3760_15G144400 [Carya illinoinensis]